VTRLVQVETAFTSFIWELNLNGTYIQSQYVAEGILSDHDIASTVTRIEGAMHLAMDLVARYTEEGRVPMLPRVNSIVPASGTPGSPVSLHGNGLKGTHGGNSKQPCRIAVNHVPLGVPDATWGDSMVNFRLPQLPDGARTGDAVWISLVVDGYETNALPFRVVKPHNRASGTSSAKA
jgi:IPT/TIG domain